MKLRLLKVGNHLKGIGENFKMTIMTKENKINQNYKSIIVNGHELTYDIHGDVEGGPALLLLSGWAHDISVFDHMIELLAKTHKVIRVNMRGHTDPTVIPDDFGFDDVVNDFTSFLDMLKIKQVIIVSHSHGSWTNLELCQRLGKERVPKAVLLDQIMVENHKDFLDNCKEIEDPKTWWEGRRKLFNHWIGVSEDHRVIDHIHRNMAAWGYDMWERSCRLIVDAYNTYGSPMKKMETLDEMRPIMHIYSQSPVSDEEYKELHENFKEKNSWFEYKQILGETHFPDLESPEEVVNYINKFIAEKL